MIRVLPRDAFNDANLLKCIGQLTLLIEDGMLSNWHFHYDGEPFNIEQNEGDGSTSVTNISFWHKKRPVFLHRPLNSRTLWPLYAIYNFGEFEQSVFDDAGNVTFDEV